MSDPKKHRDLIYLGSSKKDAEKLPQEVKDLFSTALKMAINGETHEDAKPYRHHGSGVFEVVGDYRSSTFREIYIVRYKEAVFVIHIFQKKSKKGSEVPKEDKELIEQRMKWADQIYKERYGKKKRN
jgi:phage-related protein